MSATTGSPIGLNPDRKAVHWIAAVLTMGVSAASFALSFHALSVISAWAAVPAAMAWLVPTAVDGLSLAFTLSALVASARGESATGTWWMVGALTAISSAANALVAYSLTTGTMAHWQSLVGAGLAGLFPVLSQAGWHQIARRMIARHNVHRTYVGLVSAPARLPGRTPDTDRRPAGSSLGTRAAKGRALVAGQRRRPAVSRPLSVRSERRTARGPVPSNSGRTPDTSTTTDAPDTGQAPDRATSRTDGRERRGGDVEAKLPRILALYDGGASVRTVARAIGAGHSRVGELISRERPDGRRTLALDTSPDGQRTLAEAASVRT